MATTTECPCCGTVYDPLDDMRFRGGNWVDKETGEEYGQICERIASGSPVLQGGV
jgi:hypothetical protein